MPLYHISWKRHFTLIVNGTKNTRESNILADHRTLLFGVLSLFEYVHQMFQVEDKVIGLWPPH